MALAIDRAAKERAAHREHPGPAFRAHPCAGAQEDGVAQQHGEGAAVAKADDFGQRLGPAILPGTMLDPAQRAHGYGQPGDFEQPAIAGGDEAIAVRGEIGLGRRQFVE